MSDKLQFVVAQRKRKEGLIKMKIGATLGFIPRSGCDLQPNVAARRLRWVKADGSGRNPIGVEADFNSIPRVAAAATLGWRS